MARGQRGTPRTTLGELTIETVVCISEKDNKKKWFPSHKEVEGVQYIKLEKFERGFCLFATGRALELTKERKVNHCNVQGYWDLLEARDEACQQLFQRHLQHAAELVGEKLEKCRRAREQDQYIAGRTVLATLPRIDKEPWQHPGLSMRMLWSVKSPDIWIELTEENLDYVRRCIRATLPKEDDAQPTRRRRKLREPNAGSPPSRRRRVLQNRKREQEEAHASPEPVQANEPEPGALPAFPFPEEAAAIGDQSSGSSSSDEA